MADALKPGRAPGTKNREVVAPTAAILHMAAEYGDVGHVKVARFREPPGRAAFVSIEVASAFVQLAQARDPQLARLALFLFSTGCRLGEALNLLPEDVNPAAATAYIRETKTGDDRTVHLPPALAAVMAAAIETAPKGRPLFGYADRFAVRWRWNRIRDALGVPGLTPHVCRHSYATWLRQGGSDLRLLMDAGGWRSPKSVARYAHVETAREVKAAVDASAVATLRLVKGA